MKTLILNGSPRKKGVTSQILSIMKEKALTNGSVEIIDVYDCNIQPCAGCLECHPGKNCLMPQDDGHRIAKLIDEADILILGSPTYWGNMTGPLKTLLDRCVPAFIHQGNRNFSRKLHKGKQALIVTASNAPIGLHLLPSQSRGAVRAMKTVLKGSGFRIKGILNIPDARRFDEKKDGFELQAKGLISRTICNSPTPPSPKKINRKIQNIHRLRQTAIQFDDSYSINPS
jgi:multimeric flavodoxin WrbA